MSSDLLRRYVNLILEASATVVGPFKLISVQDGIATVAGHEPIQLGPSVKDTLKPGYNYAFELAGDQAHRVILLVVDIVVHTDTEVLLIKRKNNPYAGHWALPGGFIDPGETPMQAALRELVEETGVELNSAPTLVGEFREPYRDPRMEHTWSWAYKLHIKDRAETVAGDDASAASWIPINQLGQLQMAFDHATILKRALNGIQ
ncbi:COG1051 ADP-ribose pyrophosphatase [uncultured Caudovirales phage]|uniref:COG1051 ADP-ribose pyrophosphatase n=1 Tax=uncultured Caudovirales phage TaxID=2100421 RepID=A0A6J7WK29_9CAUD|nr:COG1051 ADP-ribose pyrophosphatase [uncultured Caudovirales phage]